MARQTMHYLFLLGLAWVIALCAFPAALAQETPEPAVPSDSIEKPAVPRPPAWRYLNEQVSILGNVHIDEDQYVQGQVVCIGGDASIDGHVDDQVVVIGGSLHLSGTVEGQVVALLSQVTLDEGAVIEGEFITIGGPVSDAGAFLHGDQRVNVPLPYPIIGKGRPFAAISSLIAWFKSGQLLIMFLFLLLIAAVAPRQVVTISEEAPASFPLALLIGFLVEVLLVVVNIILVLSVIGIPLVFLLVIGEKIVKMVGRAGLFHYYGDRVGRGFNRQMSLLGAICLGFLPFALLTILPLFFGVFGLILGIMTHLLLVVAVDWPAIGLFFLTRGGNRRRSLPAATPAAPIADPAAPQSEQT